MSAHECENANNHVAVSGLANTLHPVLFYGIGKPSLFCQSVLRTCLFLCRDILFPLSCQQKGRNLVCGVENEDFNVLFCFVHLSVVLNFSLFVNKLENSSLCELSIQTGVCFVELGNDHFRHLSVHDQEECYKLEEVLLMSNTVYIVEHLKNTCLHCLRAVQVVKSL